MRAFFFHHGPIVLALAVLFLSAVFFRPLLPVNETRYMSAAWEMYLRGDWLAPLTLNFQPYHHKPPLLFWLINLSWSVFGVSRWAALLPIIVMAGLSLELTRRLGRALFPAMTARPEAPAYLMLGSAPFLIYGSIVMFDVTLTVFVLLTLLSLYRFAETRRPVYILAMALAMGLGVLTKGPVAWLYVIFPMILGRFWLAQGRADRGWSLGCLAAVLLSVLPVLLWLVPVLLATDKHFAFWLIWEQTAGRISGNFNDAHVRPFYFYLPLIPVMFLPWALFPSFWRKIKAFRRFETTGERFLLCWLTPVFLSFSLISGKQPHYLLPLLPGVMILIAAHMPAMADKARIVALCCVAALALGQAAAAPTVFKYYDLQPMADYVARQADRDWAFVRKYHGELTFLGRLEHGLHSEDYETIGVWFKMHPDGMAVIRYGDPEQVKDYKMLFTMPYRGRHLGVFVAG